MSWQMLTLAAVAAGLPTIAYLALVWWVDRYEKEPLHLLAVGFLWGALPAAVLAVLLEAALAVPLLAIGDPLVEWRQARLLAPLTEEIIKGAALLALARWHHHEFNGVLDGIIYGAFVGLGFALTENFLVFAADFASGEAALGPVLVGLRAVVFGLNHPLYTALFGAGLGWARYRRPGPARGVVPGLCLLAAMMLHWLHNALAAGEAGPWWGLPLALLADWGGLGLIVALVTLAWAAERHWIEEGLRAEVAAGTVTAAEYALVASHRSRALAEWRAVRRLDWRRALVLWGHMQALVDLAFARYHLADGRSQPADLRRRRDAVRRGRLRLGGPPIDR